MITDEQLNLITAGIDGELGPKEARRLRRLLAGSAEARAVFARLKGDRDRLQNLPPVQPPADLHRRVMARIAAVTPPPVPHPAPAPAAEPLPCARTLGRWVPVAVAAGLLIAVTASSFWFFTHQDRPQRNTRAGDPEWANVLPSAGTPSPATPVPADRKVRPERGHVARDPDPDVPLPRPVQRDGVAQAPEPRPAHGDLHAFPAGPEIPPFDFVEVRVPFLKALAEFEREDIRQELARELSLDPAFRIDLFARDTARGAELLQAAARASGVTVFSDATTADRLRKRHTTAVVIYTESLTAAELTALFGKLGELDAKVSPRVFDVLHATPVSPGDQKTLTALLGFDPGLFKRPAGEKRIDSSRPLSAGTADHVIRSLAGSPGGKGGEKTAVLLTWGPPAARTPPGNSQELKHYVMKRGERKPTAVPVIIVIRPGNG